LDSRKGRPLADQDLVKQKDMESKKAFINHLLPFSSKLNRLLKELLFLDLRLNLEGISFAL